MYKLIFATTLLISISMNSQTIENNPLKIQIEKSKSKIDLEKERIVKANTLLLTDAKKRISNAEEKYKKAIDIYNKEKNTYKATVSKEKRNIKMLNADIKKYK